jgi:hypothetical protein
MAKLRNSILALCGVFTMLFVGLSSSPAGATPPALNNVYLETSTFSSFNATTLSGISASQSAGTVTIVAGTGSQQFTLRISVGNQLPQAGTEYDTAHGASISGNGCGNTAAEDSGVFVDQAVYNGASQPTTLGVEFNILCSAFGVQYIGTAAFNLLPSTPSQGYYIYGDDGSLAGFGNDSYLNYLGDLTTVNLNRPIVGMATTPDDAGYWMVATDGGIFGFGDANFYGSTGAIHLNQPIVGMAVTHDGGGYWLVASDGGIFSFGDATYYGSTGAIHLNKPIVGMAVTPSGHGYWLVASDGGIFTFGDAAYYGSTGAIHLNKPIVGMAATHDGLGYWLVATDGGIFAFGDAVFWGSTGSIKLNQPIVGMLPTTPTGNGYLLVAQDGGIFAFGGALFKGSLGGLGVTNAIGITR